MHFIVRSINEQEQSRSSFIEASSYDEVLQKLENQNSMPLHIITIPNFLSPFIPSNRGKISQDGLVELLGSLHLVIKSGLPLYQGIVDLAEDSRGRFRTMLLQIAHSIHSGQSLSAAFEPYKDTIDAMILNLIKVGEETGQLQATLLRGATFLKRSIALKKKAKSALIYPAFAFFTVMGAMFVWMIYVLPQLIELFIEMDVKLPTLTIIIINVSNFLSEYIVYMLIAFVLSGAIFKILHKRYQIVRWYTDKFLLKIPVIKYIISSFNAAFITEYIRLALVSGVPIFNALESLKLNLNNELYKKALVTASAEIEKGKQLSSSFAKTGLFTPFMIRMMRAGESSGTLDEQLNLISDYYYEKVDYYAENIGKFIEPVVLIIVGAFMALVIVGLIGPIYDLVSQMNK